MVLGKSVRSTEELRMLAQVSPSVDVSICILNWNGAKLLAGCLQSVREIRRSNRIRYEVIVVDNGSSDDSVEMVRSQFPG